MYEAGHIPRNVCMWVSKVENYYDSTGVPSTTAVKEEEHSLKVTVIEIETDNRSSIPGAEMELMDELEVLCGRHHIYTLYCSHSHAACLRGLILAVIVVRVQFIKSTTFGLHSTSTKCPQEDESVVDSN